MDKHVLAAPIKPKPLSVLNHLYGAKQGVSAGISGHSFLRFLSLCALARLSGDFWHPVSASKNSVPGGRAWARSPSAVAAVCRAVVRDLGPALQLFRIESERLELSAPFSRRIAEPLDTDAAGQATFYGGFDKIGCDEGERDGHIDLPDAAFLASAELCDRGHSA